MINSMARSLVTAKKWYRNISAGNPQYSEMELISTSLITSDTASITFNVTGLGSSYKHLQVRLTSRNTSLGADGVNIRLNSDTGSNYTTHVLYGTGSQVLSAAGTGQSFTTIGLSSGSAPANLYGASVTDLLDAFSTTKNKTLRSFVGEPQTPYVQLRSGLWLSTAAVTSLTIYTNSGSFTSGSRFSLYGIKG